MFSFYAIYWYIQLLVEKLANAIPESYISVSMFVNILAKAWDFYSYYFQLKYAGILLRSVYKTYRGPLSIPRFNEVCNIKVTQFFAEMERNTTTINVLVPGSHTYLLLEPVPCDVRNGRSHGAG